MISIISLSLSILMGTFFLMSFGERGKDKQVLRVKGIIIEDSLGRERILIGAPIPYAKNRVRTDTSRVRKIWAKRFPNPDQFMKSYLGYTYNTNGIVFLNEEGFDRIALGDPTPDPWMGNRDPGAGLIMNDAKGNERTGYAVFPEGPFLGLDEKNANEGLTLMVLDDGNSGVFIQNSKKRESIYLGTSPPNGPKAKLPYEFNGLIIKDSAGIKYKFNTKDKN